jgi:hypothetical protein
MPDVSYVCNDHQYSLAGGAAPAAAGKPWADVTFILRGHSYREWCLVDTGADDSMLDDGAAMNLGVNTLDPPDYFVRNSSGGRTTYHREPQVYVTFAGLARPVTVQVLFGQVSVPILGRSALTALPALELGFTNMTWQHT